MNIQSMYRSPFATLMHFDEAGAGAAAGAGAGEGVGAGAKPWFEGVDAETIGHWDNKGFKKDDPKALVTELTKAWKGLEKHFGASADQIVKLPKDATDEAGWSAVRQRLGMPKEAKEYDFTNVKYADGRDIDPALADALRNTLHKAGTPKDAAPEVAKAVAKVISDADAAKSAERIAKVQAERTQVQKEWGPNFDFNRLQAMQGAKRAVGTDEGAQKLVASMEEAIGYRNTMEFWRKIGAGTTEDTFVESGQGGSPVTVNGAKARIAELKGDPDWAGRFLKGGSKERQEMDNLLALVHGVAA